MKGLFPNTTESPKACAGKCAAWNQVARDPHYRKDRCFTCGNVREKHFRVYSHPGFKPYGRWSGWRELGVQA